MDGCTDGQMDEWLYRWTGEWMVVQMDRWMNGCTGGQVNGWLYRWTGEWMVVQMDR